MPRIPAAVKACKDQDAKILNSEENSMREAANAGATYLSVNYCELHRISADSANCHINGECKTLAQIGTYLTVVCSRFCQLRSRFRQPDNGMRHDFLKRLARTFSQGITSKGFSRCRAIRRSSSLRCVSVRDLASASMLSQTASSN